mgnify:CR=1 FL=1
MGLFDVRIPYKPFEYPDYYTEGWLKQAQAFWLHTEIPMSGDVKDWNENLTKEEKNLVGNILLGFAQTECAVSDYWTQKVVSWFPKHEIQQMAMMFGSQETIHAVAYSYLNETLKLEEDETLLDACKEDIYTAAKTMIELEEKYIDKMFEMGDIEGIKSFDLKQFIRKRTNEKLQELGYTDKRRFFHYDKQGASNLDWFFHLTGGHTHTDFFAVRPTDYSKANEGEDFEDIW